MKITREIKTAILVIASLLLFIWGYSFLKGSNLFNDHKRLVESDNNNNIMTIRFFLLQNKQGKTRLSKWYQTAPGDTERVKLEADVFRIISMRGRGYTNFVE